MIAMCLGCNNARKLTMYTNFGKRSLIGGTSTLLFTGNPSFHPQRMAHQVPAFSKSVILFRCLTGGQQESKPESKMTIGGDKCG